jgi:hypothetical protein
MTLSGISFRPRASFEEVVVGSTRYVQIICNACGGKIVAVVGQARPTTCPLCKEPLEHLVAPTTAKSPARQTDSTTRPATFTRGTFTSGIPVTRPRPTPQKNSGDLASAVSDLKDKLKRLFNSRG